MEVQSMSLLSLLPGKLLQLCRQCTNTVHLKINYTVTVAGVRELFTHACG
jgi:hypothetical protein